MFNIVKRSFEIKINQTAKANVLTKLKNAEVIHQVILVNEFNKLVQIEVKTLKTNIQNILLFVLTGIGLSFIFNNLL
jgi:hypothetical protein